MLEPPSLTERGAPLPPIRVRTHPGHTAFTSTPRGASSSAASRVQAFRATFEIWYADDGQPTAACLPTWTSDSKSMTAERMAERLLGGSNRERLEGARLASPPTPLDTITTRLPCTKRGVMASTIEVAPT